MADNKDLSVGVGIKLDTKSFSKDISLCRNILDKFMQDISQSGKQLNKTISKNIRGIVNSFNVAGYGSNSGTINTYTKKGELSRAGKKPENAYFEEVVRVNKNIYKELGENVVKLNTGIEALATNMNIVQQLANKTNSAFMQTENYQTLISNKVENQLKSSIANKKAILEHIDLKKQEKQLQGQINKELKDTEDSTQKQTKNQTSLITQIRRMFTSLYVIKRFVGIFADMVRLSGDWTENLNLFVVSFGQKDYKKSLDWATEFSDRLGASVNEIVKLTANFRQLTSAIGYTQEISDSLSRTLTSLAYDLTSYYNLKDVDTAYTKLSSGVFSGQVKTLRSLGIDVSAESITTYLKELSGTYSEFIGITNSGLDQSQKVLARTLLVMRSASNSFGDMARSIETLANRQRVFQASLQNLKLALGDLASDTMSNLLAYSNGFIRAITTIIRVFKPLKTELDYEVGGTVLGALNEDAEEAQKNLNKLSFDKFETLTGGDDSKGQLSITEALTKELKNQIALYNEQVSKFDGIDKTAQSVYNSVLKWAFPLSEIDEKTGEITLNTEQYSEALQNILNIGTSLSEIWDSFKPIVPVLVDISSSLLNIVGSIITVLDKMGYLKEVVIALMALNILSKLATLHTLLNPIVLIVGTLVGLVALIVSSWSDMTWIEQLIAILGTLLATISALAIAIMAVKGILNPATLFTSISALVAGSAMVIGAITSAKSRVTAYENGGSLDLGTQIWGMNEKGNPEFMFNAGGYDSVINADILERAIANGTASAIASSGLLEKASQGIVIKGDNIDNSAFARAIFPALQKESTRLGGNKL